MSTTTTETLSPDAEVTEGEEVVIDDGSEEEDENLSTSITATTAIIIVVSLGQLGYLIYYYGWLWTMLKKQYEYTQWLGAPIPGPLIDSRYDLQWIFMSFMAYQYLPPLAGLWMLKSHTNSARHDVYRVAAAAGGLICVGCFLFAFVFSWIFQTNSTFYPFSWVNDVEYCCKYWGDVAASLHCHNTNNCIDLPPPNDIYLNSNSIFRGILWGFLILVLFNGAHFLLSAWNWKYVSAALATKKGEPKQVRPRNTAKGGVIAIHVFNVILVILIVFFLLFGLLTLDVRYTHEFPAPGPFGLRSARSGIGVVGLVMSASIIMVPAFVLLAMLAEGNYYALVATLIGYIVLVVLHAFSLLTMIMTRGVANLPGRPNNLANHPLRCCAPDVYADTLSECDNAGPCTLPFDGFPSFTTLPASSGDIPCNPVHTVIFVFMILFLILEIVLGILIFVTYFGRSVLKHTGRTVEARISAFVDFIDAYIETPIKSVIDTQDGHARTHSHPSAAITGTTTTRRRKHPAQQDTIKLMSTNGDLLEIPAGPIGGKISKFKASGGIVTSSGSANKDD